MPHSAHHVPSAGPPVGGRRAGWPVHEGGEMEKSLGKFINESLREALNTPLDHAVLIGSSMKSTRDTMNTQSTTNTERNTMPTLKQWADAHGPQPVKRIAARMERFAGNTGDPETALAAAELCKLLRDSLPLKEQDDNPAGS